MKRRTERNWVALLTAVTVLGVILGCALAAKTVGLVS